MPLCCYSRGEVYVLFPRNEKSDTKEKTINCLVFRYVCFVCFLFIYFLEESVKITKHYTLLIVKTTKIKTSLLETKQFVEAWEAVSKTKLRSLIIVSCSALSQDTTTRKFAVFVFCFGYDGMLIDRPKMAYTPTKKPSGLYSS